MSILEKENIQGLRPGWTIEFTPTLAMNPFLTLSTEDSVTRWVHTENSTETFLKN
jgi:hypothetical protein